MLVGEAGDVEPAAQLVRWGSRPHSVRFTERTVFSSLGKRWVWRAAFYLCGEYETLGQQASCKEGMRKGVECELLWVCFLYRGEKVIGFLKKREERLISEKDDMFWIFVD